MDRLYTRLQTFSELIGCAGELYLSQYDPQMRLTWSNCSQPEFWDNIFQTTACCGTASAHCASSPLPILLSEPTGMLWIAAGAWENDALQQIYLLGPVFMSVGSEAQIEASLSRRNISPQIRADLLAHLKRLPSMVHTTFLMLGVMLHYCITGQKIQVYDIILDQAENRPTPQEHSQEELSTHGSADYEALMLKTIEDGNLNYRELLSGGFHGNVGVLAVDDSLRQFKNEIIISIALCCRAAIRGGLSREVALTLSDLYIQSVESASTISEIAHISHTVREDYIQRVHKAKRETVASPAVRACLDIIDAHITEPLSIASLARQTGYAGYYISSLFKKELGVSIGSYMKSKKIGHAKLLLTTTSKSIRDIAADLHFSSASHFCAAFREDTGISPGEYRAKGKG